MQNSWLIRGAIFCGAMVLLYYLKQTPYNLWSSENGDQLLVDERSRVPVTMTTEKSDVHSRSKPNTAVTCAPEDRTNHLKNMCGKEQLDTFSKTYDHMDLYVNEQHKYVACLPQKSGCTTWKIILVNNSVATPLAHGFDGRQLHGPGMVRYGLKRLSEYNKKEKHKILSQYFKFMVVRHPLDRLLSSYNDKIVLGYFPHHRAGVLKLESEKYNTSRGDLGAFLEYILQNSSSNEHWSPASSLCDVCNVKYDKIVKLETQQNDMLDIIPHLGPYNRSSDVHANKKGSGAALDFSWTLLAYLNVSKALLDEVLATGFGDDLRLFGYSWSNISSVTGLSVRCSYPETQCC